MADSPNLARPYCPGCDLLADVTTEILETRWCSAHAPATLGQLDHVQPSYQSYLSGNADAEGWGNRAFCDLIHRKGASGLVRLEGEDEIKRHFEEQA